MQHSMVPKMESSNMFSSCFPRVFHSYDKKSYFQGMDILKSSWNCTSSGRIRVARCWGYPEVSTSRNQRPNAMKQTYIDRTVASLSGIEHCQIPAILFAEEQGPKGGEPLLIFDRPL